MNVPKVLVTRDAEGSKPKIQKQHSLDRQNAISANTINVDAHDVSHENIASIPVPPKRKSSHLLELESDLPEDPGTLKGLCVDLLISQTIFQERCKETIRQLIEEKHVALHKNRLLEQAAGIQDRETSERFIDQLQYLQDENEKLSATIAYLKISIQMFEHAAAQQDEYYRKNLADLTKQHHEQLQAIFRRNEETEKAFLAYQKVHSEELAELARLRTEVATTKGRPPSSKMENSLQAEIQSLRKDLATIVAEKLALEERLKLTEKLKSMADQENNILRNDMSKLRKLMQEEVLKQLQEARQERDEVDESSGNIIFSKGEGGQKRLKGATSAKLVERMLDPAVHDHHFLQTILLTHKIFMSSKELLALIVGKYAESTAGLSEEAIAQSPILLRILNVLKIWVEHYWSDFSGDPELIDQLQSFMQSSVKSDHMMSGLRAVLNRKLSPEVSNTDPATQTPPKPILPRVLAKRYSNDSIAVGRSALISVVAGGIGADRPTSWAPFGGKGKLAEGTEDVRIRLADVEPLELARQLTLIEFDLFRSINSREYLDLAWMKDSKERDAPNILRMTRWSNHVVQWIVTEIVLVKDNTKSRAAMFERILMLGQALERLNNFNGVKEVVAALQTASLYRLKKTKEAMGSKYMRMYDELCRLVSSDLNYKNMRAKIRAADPPLIPFPGLYQGDLVFIDTCHRDRLKNDLINYSKLESIARSILELEAYQQVSYSLEPVPEIQDYIRHYEPLDDDQAYNASLACEPKAG